MAWLVVEQAIGKAVTITVPPSSEPTVIRVSPSSVYRVNSQAGPYVRIGYEAPRDVEILRDDAVKRSKGYDHDREEL